MKTFTEGPICASRGFCVVCRGADAESIRQRETWIKVGHIAVTDFECPHGVTRQTALIEQTHALVALATSQEQLTAQGKALRQSSTSCCGGAEEVAATLF